MEKINNILDRVATPITGLADWLLRLGLGIAFFLHGFLTVKENDPGPSWPTFS